MEIRIAPMKGVSFAEVEAILRPQLESGLDRMEANIAAVDAVVRDLNGPRGGIDQACRLTAHFVSGESVTVSDKGEDLTAVLIRGAQRLGQAVSKLVEKRRNRRKTPSMAGHRNTWEVRDPVESVPGKDASASDFSD